MTAPTNSAKLTLNGQSYDLPVLSPTIGPDVLDIRKLYGQADVFTFDPGFTSTAACESAITYIDGDKGELLHRGYPIEQLAAKSSYIEVCYLLLYGELPSADQLADFEGRVTRHTMVHEQMHYFFRGFRRDSHPMATMVGVVGAMSAFYHDSLDINDPWQREVAAIRMIAKLPTIAAMAYKYSVGQPFVYPKNSLDYAGNFLQHVLCRPGRRLCREPGPRQGARPHHDAARRPRAERLDLDRASGRLVGGQSLRLCRRRHRLPVGAGPRRRQPGLS